MKKSNWIINAGPFEVHVKGTQFRVSWDASRRRFGLKMFKGKVEVNGPVLKSRGLSQGESVEVWVDEKRLALNAAVDAIRDPEIPTGKTQKETALQEKRVWPNEQDKSSSIKDPKKSANSHKISTEMLSTPTTRVKTLVHNLKRRSEVNSPSLALNPVSGVKPIATQTVTDPTNMPSTSSMSDKEKTSVIKTTGDKPSNSTIVSTKDNSPAVTFAKQPASNQTGTPSNQPVSKNVEAPKPKINPWDLAANGNYKEAIQSGDLLGWASIMESAKAEHLTVLATAAKAQHRTTLAIELLKVVRRRFSSSSTSAEAAYTLGCIYFHQQKKAQIAAEWFKLYLREKPSGSLAREAHGRLVESLFVAGHSDPACAAAHDYLMAYPHRPHASFVQRVIRGCDEKKGESKGEK